MSSRRRVVTGGIGALVKSTLLVVGVPTTLIRLWELAPPLHTSTSPSSALSWAGLVRLVLIVVAAIWVWASLALVRELADALRARDRVPSGSWSHRWATAIAALFLTVTAGSAVAATVTVSRTTTVHAVPRTLGDAPPSPMRRPLTSGTTATIRDGECLGDVALRATGERGAWVDLARRNLGTDLGDGTRFVDANLLRPGWCLQVPPATAVAVDPDRPHGSNRSLDEMALLGLGTLVTAAVARRVRGLRRLTESGRVSRAVLDQPPTVLGEIEAAVGPLAESLLVDWIDAALRLAGARGASSTHSGALDIRLVRAGPAGVELLLVTPDAHPPAPMRATGDGRWWVLDAVDLSEPALFAPGSGRLVPWLIPVGEDADAVCLVAVGPGVHLVVNGESKTTAAVLRGILAGLRTLPWATELDVELLGLTAPPPGERSFQIHASSAATLRALASEPPRPSRIAVTPAWRREPLAIVVGSSRDDLDEATLDALGGVAGIISDHGEGTVVLSVDDVGRAELAPFGLTLSVPRPSTPQSGLLDRLLTSAADTTTLAVGAPATTNRPVDASSLTAAPGRGAVDLTVLTGAPAVNGLTESPPERERARLVELFVYLALHDRHATTTEIGAAMFSREEEATVERRVRDLLGAARALLPVDGNPPLLLVTAAGTVTLESGVTVDWERVRATFSNALDAAPDHAIAELTRGLEAVDRPSILDPTGDYDWMTGERLGATMRGEIVDAAHHLATLALASDDLDLATWSIARGVAIEPMTEILLRDAMVLDDRRGDPASATGRFRAFERALESLAGAEPTAESRALHRALTELPR